MESYWDRRRKEEKMEEAEAILGLHQTPNKTETDDSNQNKANQNQADEKTKIMANTPKDPKEAVKKRVISLIDGLVSKGWSYKRIGKRLNMSSGKVYLLHSGKWYPKTILAENKILEAIYGKK